MTILLVCLPLVYQYWNDHNTGISGRGISVLEFDNCIQHAFLAATSHVQSASHDLNSPESLKGAFSGQAAAHPNVKKIEKRLVGLFFWIKLLCCPEENAQLGSFWQGFLSIGCMSNCCDAAG